MKPDYFSFFIAFQNEEIVSKDISCFDLLKSNHMDLKMLVNPYLVMTNFCVDCLCDNLFHVL